MREANDRCVKLLDERYSNEKAYFQAGALRVMLSETTPDLFVGKTGSGQTEGCTLENGIRGSASPLRGNHIKSGIKYQI